MKAFHKAILPGAPRLDVDRLDPVLFQPPLHDLRDELRAVVAPQICRRAVLRNGLLQPVPHIRRLQHPFGPQHMALPGVFLQNGPHLQSPAAHRRIRNEVPRPHMIPRRRRRGPTRGNTAPNHFALRRCHPQARVSSQALDVPLAHPPAFPPQQRRDPPIPIPRMFSRAFQQPLLQPFCRGGWRSPAIVERRTRQLQKPARLPLRTHLRAHHFLRIRPATGRAHSFFRIRSSIHGSSTAPRPASSSAPCSRAPVPATAKPRSPPGAQTASSTGETSPPSCLPPGRSRGCVKTQSRFEHYAGWYV